MNASVSCLTAPVVHGISEAKKTVKHAVESCRQRGHRAIRQLAQGVAGYSRQFKEQHPVATRNLKTVGDYAVKAARTSGNGVKVAAKGIARIYNRITTHYQDAKRFVETCCPKRLLP